MQVNFAHNYSKTFFKGSSPSSETKTASDKQPLTAEEFRSYANRQAQDTQAILEALRAIVGILRESATPSIDINNPTIKKPILNYIGVINKPTLNQGDIVKTNEVGDIITHTRRDGSIVTVEEGPFKTIMFHYSKCPNRNKNGLISEVIRNQDTPEERFERHWKNGTYECFDANGNLIETTIIKSDGCEIKFRRNPWSGKLKETSEKFLPTPEGENTQYPKYFAIHPDYVIYDENDNLKTIIADYQMGPSYEFIKIDSWDGVANKIQSYSYPVSKIDFYPSGQIKSELYTFKLKGRDHYDFTIKFNENGQVDDVIVADGDNKVDEKTSSQIKKELIEAGYKGYAEYASDIRERARIAISVRKRYEETPQ